ASECLFLACNEIPTTACIQGIQKEGGMQLEAKRGTPWPLKGFFHSLSGYAGYFQSKSASFHGSGDFHFESPFFTWKTFR
ncbi:MAG TPA: hypothetical protein VNQ90_13825, partial [Chthoniobacteraceae bacterium]|nr:hypothetical protein [Chthoniobacteraceae bacterium]